MASEPRTVAVAHELSAGAWVLDVPLTATLADLLVVRRLEDRGAEELPHQDGADHLRWSLGPVTPGVAREVLGPRVTVVVTPSVQATPRCRVRVVGKIWSDRGTRYDLELDFDFVTDRVTTVLTQVGALRIGVHQRWTVTVTDPAVLTDRFRSVCDVVEDLPRPTTRPEPKKLNYGRIRLSRSKQGPDEFWVAELLDRDAGAQDFMCFGMVFPGSRSVGRRSWEIRQTSLGWLDHTVVLSMLSTFYDVEEGPAAPRQDSAEDFRRLWEDFKVRTGTAEPGYGWYSPPRSRAAPASDPYAEMIAVCDDRVLAKVRALVGPGLLVRGLANLPKDKLKQVYRLIAAEVHPDRGGTHDKMQRLNVAWGKVK